MNEQGTCFKKVDYTLKDLLTYISLGDVGLPDIQRPFVWPNAKVRDLFDSMYKGFPVGYLLFWGTNHDGPAKAIGTDKKQHSVPKLVIVDGQQRLTSLYAVFTGRTIVDEDYQARHIEIAFRPRDGKFEVADAAVRKDPEFIPNISQLWASGKSGHSLVTEFIRTLKAKAGVTESEEETIARNLERLIALQSYPFTALEIASNVDEEQVADIFVRINSEGVNLKQADFILTLLSVFWEEGRVQLEDFSRESRKPPGKAPSPFNHFINPDPDQLLRVSVALGFRRGRLKSVYQILRGKDVETDTYLPEKRDHQFDILKDAQAHVLNLTYWHQFLNSLVGAGFRSRKLVSSIMGLLYTYAFYLIGRTQFGLPDSKLQPLIGRFFFATSLTGRYTSSPESVMDGDLARLRDLTTADQFAEAIDRMCRDTLTGDYWTITLPSEMDTSSARNPKLFAFYAAQNRLGAPALFSKKKVSDLLDPTVKHKKEALERHHLFPKAYLKKNGITSAKQTNQMANYALLEWPDNIQISDDAPSEYVPRLREHFSEAEWETMHKMHALPDGWENMDYSDFLEKRRHLMAEVIRKGFESL